MKIFAMIALSLASIAASAVSPEIRGGRMNIAKQAIEIDVSYGGGCKEHKFVLKVGGCLESYPVQCGAQLVDLTSDDFCEAFIHQTILIPLKDAGLDDGYYTGASITIKGGRDSKVHVTLPRN